MNPEIVIWYPSLVTAIQPSEEGADDAGYLNIRDGEIVFALPEGCDIVTSPGDWIKIPKTPVNYSGTEWEFIDQFVAEISKRYGLYAEFNFPKDPYWMNRISEDIGNYGKGEGF